MATNLCWLTLAFPGGWSNWNETWHQETPTHRLGRCQPFPASHPNNWPIPSSKKHVPPWVPAACPGVQSFQPQSIRATRLALHYLLITSWSLVGRKLHAQTTNQNCQHIATYRKYLSRWIWIYSWFIFIPTAYDWWLHPAAGCMIW